MRILESRAAESYVRKLERRGQKLDALEPRVRRIVQNVRRDGDGALRRYAETWDGLGAGDPLRVSEGEMKAALKASSPELRVALETAAENIRTFCEWQKPANWERRKAGAKVGPIDTAAQLGRMLRARRTLSSAFNFADDGDSGAGRGSERYSSGLASSGSGDAGGSSAVGSA